MSTTTEQQTNPRLGFLKRFLSRFRRNTDATTAKCGWCDKVGLKEEMFLDPADPLRRYFCTHDHYVEICNAEVW